MDEWKSQASKQVDEHTTHEPLMLILPLGGGVTVLDFCFATFTKTYSSPLSLTPLEILSFPRLCSRLAFFLSSKAATLDQPPLTCLSLT